MRTRIALAAALATLAATAFAAQRDDYGYEWPLLLSQQAGAQRLDVPPEVYAHLYDHNLRDLDAFNAAGEPLPLGTVPEPAAPPVAPPSPERVVLPMFALPAQPVGVDGGDLHLRIERDPSGVLRRVDADVTSTEHAEPARDVLLDASAVKRPIAALELSWADVARAQVDASYRVLGSDDLDHWRPLVAEARILDLSQNGFALQRRRIDVSTPPRYLLLQRLDAGAPVALDGASALLIAEAIDVRSKPAVAPARFVAEDKKQRAYDFAAPGPLPSIGLELTLASPNTVASVQVLSRDSDTGYWQLRASFTAFRVTSGNGEATHEPQAIGWSRDRQWRVVSNPPLDAPPVLKLSYRPDTFVVLPRGAEPYVLTAGSSTARRADYPMQELLSALARTRHEPAALAAARLGEMRATRGDEALRPPSAGGGSQTRRYVLWATLALGAAAVIFMVLNLMRESPPKKDPQ